MPQPAKIRAAKTTGRQRAAFKRENVEGTIMYPVIFFLRNAQY
ncbi:hypothetical protein HMPREF9532_01501 [Escherichia coli MS 57-2]|nr:hypothetical protein HMPREF9532_01501 [Escherichia coli MS 57-2]KEJ37917.1 hypothetical protein AB65_4050 [Escherichia coli 2-460-02_S1_C3]